MSDDAKRLREIAVRFRGGSAFCEEIATLLADRFEREDATNPPGWTTPPREALTHATEQGAYELGVRDGIEKARRAVRDARERYLRDERVPTVLTPVDISYVKAIDHVLALIGGLS